MTHVANSAALLTYFPQSAGTWVRPGIALYGIYPNPLFKNRVALTPVMQVKARIIHLKKIDKGHSVSYGRTYTAKKPVSVATVALDTPMGFTETFQQSAVLGGGRKVPQIGTICMDMSMLDVTRVKDVRVGDEAVFFGRQGKARSVWRIKRPWPGLFLTSFCALWVKGSPAFIFRVKIITKDSTTEAQRHRE